MRLDIYLVTKGFFDSRTKAQNAIKSEDILVDGKLITKPNFEVEEPQIEILKKSNPYVSRGGLKLEEAIQSFQLDFKNKVILDVGASTGGFTDCALKHGASKVYALDVGTSQLDDSLRQDSRVISMENTNILDLFSLPEPIDFIVMDVSFVSIEKLLPAIDRFLTNQNRWICLIKPQFEVGKVYFKNGVIKDSKIHLKVLEQVEAALESYHMAITKLIPSPILGGSGNKEFLAYIEKDAVCRVNFLKSV